MEVKNLDFDISKYRIVKRGPFSGNSDKYKYSYRVEEKFLGIFWRKSWLYDRDSFDTFEEALNAIISWNTKPKEEINYLDN